jgi:hypothetical protein
MIRPLVQLGLLCLLRLGPQDLPYSTRLLLQWLGLLLCVQALAAGALGAPQDLPLRLLLSFGLLLGPAWLLLGFLDLRARYVQTVSAFAGSGLLFSVLAIPAALLLRGLSPESAEQGVTAAQGLGVWLLLGMTVWKLVVDSHIWRHALGCPPPVAIGLTLALFLIELLAVRQLS